MPSTPNESPIKMTPALEEKVRNATSTEEITAIMQDAMVEQHLAQRDPWANEVLIPVEPGTAPRELGRTITVNGVKHIITSDAKDGELGLERAVIDFFRQLQQEDANGTRTDQRRDDKGRFAAKAEAETDAAKAAADVERVELELKFKRGEISTDEYLAQSGAIERHLASQGLSLEALRAATDRGLVNDWESATEEFLQSEAAADWPGGEANQAILGKILIDMGAAEYPSAENMRRAHEFMRENNLVVATPESDAFKRIDAAESRDELEKVISTLSPRANSSLFGQ